MPLNTLRLNYAPSSHPNERIIFIKPLPRPSSQATDYQTADTLLRAIAAQCLPIMKKHYLSVTTLEEYEPNPEFIGRNFNNGEIIQLVLRGKNGGWLPVNMIQMVMMHELAHNVHMNHGKKFWETRNSFAGEMRRLWAEGYTGEGFWGGGRTLSQLGDAVSGNVVQSEELKVLPLCGGTFRSRKRKRKAKDDGLTWREKKERRIEKKFGKNGVALGEDEDKRLSLELSGKGPVGVKPRVAQSKRGRELRAAAALARFGTNKEEVDELEPLKPEEESTQSEDEDADADANQEDARGVDGNKILDSKGQGMIKVCEEEDEDDVNVKQEMEDLQSLDFEAFSNNHRHSVERTVPSHRSDHSKANGKANNKIRSLYDIPQHRDDPSTKSTSPLSSQSSKSIQTKPKITIHKSQPKVSQPPASTSWTKPQPETTCSIPLPPKPSTKICPICSLENAPLNPTCAACSHVLDRRKDPRSWKCSTNTCLESEYINAGDVGVCGVCGSSRNDC